MNKNIENNYNNENTIIFTIGRMNPPTTGHMLLIQKMIEKAIELNLTQINIILSATVDKKKNPFSCNEKRFFLSKISPSMIQMLKEQMIEKQPEYAEKINKIQVKIVCMDDETNPIYGKHPILKSVNHILYDLYGYPRENIQMILLIGEDRKDDYDWIKKILSEKTNLPPVNLEIVGLDRPEGAMSATKIRNLALNNEWDNFRANMLPLGVSDDNIREIYNGIRNNMSVEKTTGKRKGTNDTVATKRTRTGGKKKYLKKNKKKRKNKKNKK